jgi:hypothetical protein
MKRIGITSILLGVFAVTASTPVAAFQKELERYQHAINPKICVTGISPEVLRLYEDAVDALQKARQGLGHEANFFRPMPPEIAFSHCYQSE